MTPPSGHDAVLAPRLRQCMRAIVPTGPGVRARRSIAAVAFGELASIGIAGVVVASVAAGEIGWIALDRGRLGLAVRALRAPGPDPA